MSNSIFWIFIFHQGIKCSKSMNGFYLNCLVWNWLYFDSPVGKDKTNWYSSLQSAIKHLVFMCTWQHTWRRTYWLFDHACKHILATTIMRGMAQNDKMALCSTKSANDSNCLSWHKVQWYCALATWESFLIETSDSAIACNCNPRFQQHEKECCRRPTSVESCQDTCSKEC